MFEVDFVFSCPCFVSDVLSTIESSTMNYEIDGYISGNHAVEDFEVVYFKNESSIFICYDDHFKNESSIFICYHDHLLESMQFDIKNCLHYNRRVHFRMRHDFNYYWTKKCCQCYRISIKKLWKCYPRFIC